MSDMVRLERKKAYETPSGNALILVTGYGIVICIKAEREGKEYVHHYAVPLDPRPQKDLGMIYLDPEDEVVAMKGAHPGGRCGADKVRGMHYFGVPVRMQGLEGNAPVRASDLPPDDVVRS